MTDASRFVIGDVVEHDGRVWMVGQIEVTMSLIELPVNKFDQPPVPALCKQFQGPVDDSIWNPTNITRLVPEG